MKAELNSEGAKTKLADIHRQLRLHERAVLVLLALKDIECVLAADRGLYYFRYAPKDKRAELLKPLQVIDARTLETETWLRELDGKEVTCR